MITRLIAIIPAVIVTALYGEHGIGTLIILSQVILALQLSFAVVPLVLFTSSRAKMGEFANHPVTVAFAWTTAIVIAGLNAVGCSSAWRAIGWREARIRVGAGAHCHWALSSHGSAAQSAAAD